jgi:hypothetical protein
MTQRDDEVIVNVLARYTWQKAIRIANLKLVL